LTPAGVVAFCARRGTGKSTLAARLDGRGYSLWADDAVAWVPSDDGAETWSDRGVAAQRTLATVFVVDRADAQDVRSGELDVRTVSGGSALTSVLPHAHPHTPDDETRRREFVTRYLHLAARVPIVRVRFRPDPERIDALCDAFERLIDSIAAAVALPR